MKTAFWRATARLPVRWQHAIWRTNIRLRQQERFRRRVDRRRPDADTEYGYHPFDVHRCIFVHIPKCAGISVARSLFGTLGGGHSTVRDYQIAYSPREFAEYFKFTIVRNPWDRLFSAYHYLKTGGMTPADREFSEAELAPYDDFEHFVLDWVDEESIWRYMHFQPQHHYLCFEDGPPLVDFIGRFENLSADFRVIAARLGIDRELMSLNRRSSKPGFREVYTPEMRDRVGRVYARDIEMLGYAFDG